ncbi:MAG: aspartate aminotransferase family protein [Firmicutes bacterium]|nr:aspartate aminotransferase family protein [Bacillota bacterium]
MSEAVIEAENKYATGLHKKRDLVLVRGSGARVWDSTGKEYVDCNAGHGVALVGHCNRRVVEAIQAQAERLVTCPETFYNDARAGLLSTLAEAVPAGLARFFLCNSGTEAVEAAIKFARLSTGRKEIVATMRGFHGRSMGALSATWEPKYRKPFEPLVPGFHHVPFGLPETIVEAVTEDTAAVILEVVQGEGGVHVAPPGYLEGVEEACRRKGALLIIDEVQTGFGRTGRMFACEHFDVDPDILCMSKAMGGGVPVAAVALGSRVGPLPVGVHGNTFGGNPLVCAAASAAIEFIEENDLPGRAIALGARFKARLESIKSPLIREVRGLGLMVGVELRQKNGPYLDALVKAGVLALPAGGTVIRFLPPLVIEPEDLEFAARALEGVLSNPPE